MSWSTPLGAFTAPGNTWQSVYVVWAPRSHHDRWCLTPLVSNLQPETWIWKKLSTKVRVSLRNCVVCEVELLGYFFHTHTPTPHWGQNCCQQIDTHFQVSAKWPGREPPTCYSWFWLRHSHFQYCQEQRFLWNAFQKVHRWWNYTQNIFCSFFIPLSKLPYFNHRRNLSFSFPF